MKKFKRMCFSESKLSKRYEKAGYRVRTWPGSWGERNPSWAWETSSRLMPTHMESTRHHLEDGSINIKYPNEPKRWQNNVWKWEDNGGAMWSFKMNTWRRQRSVVRWEELPEGQVRWRMKWAWGQRKKNIKWRGHHTTCYFLYEGSQPLG